MKTTEKVTGKAVAKASGKTILILVVFLAIIFLDVLVIRGAYFGVLYVGEKISDFGEYLAQLGTPSEEETAETEKKLTAEDIKEIREKEDKALQEILDGNYPPKEIPKDQ